MTTLMLRPDEAVKLRAGDRIVAIDGRHLDRELEVAESARRILANAFGVPLVNPLGTDTRWVLYPDSQVAFSLRVERPDDESAAPYSGTVFAGSSLFPFGNVDEPSDTLSTPVDSPAVAERRAKLDLQLTALARAVSQGASNPGLIKRANRLADEIADEHPDLAARLRTALTKKWESLGNRYDKLQAIRAELAPRPLADPTPAPYKPQRRTRHGLTLVGGGTSWETEDGRYIVQYQDDYLTGCEEPHPVRLGRESAARLRGLLAERGEQWFLHWYGRSALHSVRTGKKGYLCPGGMEHTYGLWAAWRTGVTGGDPIFDARSERLDDAWGDLAAHIQAEQSEGER